MMVMTKPDITFTVLQLVRFLINPGPLHHKVANKVINYLINIKDLTLHFGGFNNLEVVSTALFANNTLNRKKLLGIYNEIISRFNFVENK